MFFTHERETIDFHYERELFEVNGSQRADPRVSHAMTLEVDDYGNVQKSVAVVYGRRYDNPDELFIDADQAKQTNPLITFTENKYTLAT